MTLNLCEQACFEAIQSQFSTEEVKPLNSMTIDEFRQGLGVFSDHAGSPANVTWVDHTLQLQHATSLRCRVFNADLPDGPALIFFPGNGYVNPLFEVNAIACSRIAALLAMRVILVDLDLVPEHALPAVLNSACEAVEAIAQQRETFMVDPQALYLGGFSSGAHCAVAVSHRLIDSPALKIRHLVLLNGVYDIDQTHTDYLAFSKHDMLCTLEAAQCCMAFWGLSESERKQPLYSPVYSKQLAQLPPTTVLVSEYDGIRDQSEYFYQRLVAVGANVKKRVLAGQSHNTLILRDTMREGLDPAQVIAEVVSQ